MNPRTRLSKSQSKSFVRRRRDRLVWQVGLALVVILAWIFVLSRLSWLGAFTITNVQVYGADPEITGQLRGVALDQLNGSYFGLFARADSAIYPEKDIAAAIKNKATRVLNVDIHRTGIHGLSITVDERVPTAVICAELPDFSSGTANDSNCYYADVNGLIFEEAPTTTPQISERYYEPDLANDDAADGSSTNIIGSYATSTQEFSALQSFFDKVQAAGIPTFGILMKDAGEYELYALNPGSTNQSTTTSTGTAPDIAVIYFNDLSTFESELSDLTSFWNKEITDGRATGKLPRFESIDVRYGSSVFYRLEK